MDDAPQRFACLYDRYYRNVLRYALTHSEPGSAEDVASEVFLIAWRQLPDIPEPPLPWLLGVARNLLRQQAGAGRRQRRLADRIGALASPADTTAWDTAEHVVEREAALEVLQSLPERDIEALTLVTWHGLGAADAAAAAGWPTQPAALRGLLLTQPRQQPQGRGETPDDLVFQQASNWLWNPLVSPALRSALYKVLAATPAWWSGRTPGTPPAGRPSRSAGPTAQPGRTSRRSRTQPRGRSSNHP